MIRYEMPRDWIAYDRMAIMDELIGAKSANEADPENQASG